MKIVTKIFTSASELSNIKEELDNFLNSYCKNPFSLYPFIENYMRNYCQDVIPAILVSSVNEKIVGLAPLQLRKNFIFQRANFLLPYYISPDFVVTEEYREDVLRNFLRIIFRKINCKQIVLDLPAESQNMRVLERICVDDKLTFMKQFRETMSHCLISVHGSFGEFEKSQGNHLKKFRRISRNLDKVGNWKIILFENWQDNQNAQDAFDKMRAIERMSWKEKWRLQTGVTIDKDLTWIWHSSLSAAKTNPDFRCKIWFLELNGQAIEYHLVIEYRGTAFLTKTSYAEKYKQLSPGLFVRNAIIADQFNRQEAETIDFLTNLPYMKTWNVICLPRIRFTLNESAIPNLTGIKAIAVLNRFWHVIEYRKI
jgi:GNAT acetyltransferase-like protein